MIQTSKWNRTKRTETSLSLIIVILPNRSLKIDIILPETKVANQNTLISWLKIQFNSTWVELGCSFSITIILVMHFYLAYKLKNKIRAAPATPVLRLHNHYIRKSIRFAAAESLHQNLGLNFDLYRFCSRIVTNWLIFNRFFQFNVNVVLLVNFTFIKIIIMINSNSSPTTFKSSIQKIEQENKCKARKHHRNRPKDPHEKWKREVKGTQTKWPEIASTVNCVCNILSC